MAAYAHSRRRLQLDLPDGQCALGVTYGFGFDFDWVSEWLLVRALKARGRVGSHRCACCDNMHVTRLHVDSQECTRTEAMLRQ